MRIRVNYAHCSQLQARTGWITHSCEQCVLKLSEGDADKLKENIELARIDYRDVLAYAEYPEQMRAGPGKWKPGERGLDEIRRRDRAQYEAWLASFE